MVDRAARKCLPRFALALIILVLNVSNAISAAASFSNHKSILLRMRTDFPVAFLLLKTPGGVSVRDSYFKINLRAEDADLDLGALSLTTLRHDK